MIKSDKVQQDINKGVSEIPNNQKASFIFDLVGENIKDKFVEYFSDNKLDLQTKRKVLGLEYNYKKPEIEKVLVLYQGTDEPYYETVQLKSKVTDKDIAKVIPGSNTLNYYNNFEKWLAEDYESTLEMAKEIFGFDFETLKGANVV